ncbi:MAG: RrF2 family transcriptional regulator [Planctomycetota bacterium]|jgi:Rrf2 family protein
MKMNVPNDISQKCRYALRAVFELAWRDSKTPVKIHEIAKTQKIPQRFLEVILAELKHGRFLISKRGNDGGYFLAMPSYNITVGQIINFIEGGSKRRLEKERLNYYVPGDYVFEKLWNNVSLAISDAYHKTTFYDLVQQERQISKKYVPNYAI